MPVDDVFGIGDFGVVHVEGHFVSCRRGHLKNNLLVRNGG